MDAERTWQYYACVDPAEYNWCGIIIAYSCSPEAVTKFLDARRQRARAERKRRREEAASAPQQTGETTGVVVVAKRQRLDAQGKSKETKVIDLTSPASAVPFVARLTLPPVPYRRFTVIEGEMVKIISARFLDLHRNAALFQYDDQIHGDNPPPAISRNGPQTVGNTQRLLNLPDLPDRLAEFLADWRAIYDIHRRPQLLIEPQVDGVLDRHKAPYNLILEYATKASITSSEKTQCLGLPLRSFQRAAGKAGVPRGDPDRKNTSIVHLREAFRGYKDMTGKNIIRNMEKAELKLDDFADCYNVCLKQARLAVGIDIIEH